MQAPSSPHCAARRGRRRLATAVAVLGAAGLAGCHGTNLPLGEFQQRANAVCAQTAREVAPLADLRQLQGERLEEVAGRLKSRARAAQAELKTIIPPGDLTELYGEMLDHLGDVVEYLEELQDAAGEDSARRPAVVLEKLAESLRKFRQRADEIPLEACAQAAARALPGGAM